LDGGRVEAAEHYPGESIDLHALSWRYDGGLPGFILQIGQF
jgi:hypothetical protein